MNGACSGRSPPSRSRSCSQRPASRRNQTLRSPGDKQPVIQAEDLPLACPSLATGPELVQSVAQGLVENDTDAPVGLRLEGLSLSLGDGKLVLISDPHWTHHQCYCPKPILQANIKLVKEALRHEGAASQSPRRRPPAGTQHASTAAAGSRGSPQGAPRFRRPPVLHARRCGGLQARAGAGSQAADAAIAHTKARRSGRAEKEDCRDVSLSG